MPSKKTGNLAQFLIRKDKAIRAAIRQECMDSGQELKSAAEDAVRSWTHRPAFAVQPTIRPDYISVTVEVGGAFKKQFLYVDQGTGRYGPNQRPYEIKPKQKSGLLTFRTGYSPKTLPIAKSNVGTGQASGKWVRKRRVLHPGIKPRKFLETQGEKLIPPFDKRIQNAIVKAIQGG